MPPSLSLEKGKSGKPLAMIKGGDLDGEVLYLHEDDPAKPSPKVKREVPHMRYEKELQSLGLKPMERIKAVNKLQAAMKAGSDESLDENLKPIYARIKHNDDKSIEIALPSDSMFQLIPPPDPKKRTVWYVAGASGSGKSYIARGIGDAYRKFFPGREVYLISKLTEDETLDNMKTGKPQRIDVQTLVDNYPEISEFEDCMVIFDDIDCFDGPQLKAVHQLIDDLAITGRHTNTTMLFLTHYITNYKKTRLIINEATHFVVYPQTTSHKALSYLLGTQLGLEKDDVKELRKLGRWVCLHKNYPQYLLSANYAKILHQD